MKFKIVIALLKLVGAGHTFLKSLLSMKIIRLNIGVLWWWSKCGWLNFNVWTSIESIYLEAVSPDSLDAMIVTTREGYFKWSDACIVIIWRI